jgi:hypothetical protein
MIKPTDDIASVSSPSSLLSTGLSSLGINGSARLPTGIGATELARSFVRTLMDLS